MTNKKLKKNTHVLWNGDYKEEAIVISFWGYNPWFYKQKNRIKREMIGLPPISYMRKYVGDGDNIQEYGLKTATGFRFVKKEECKQI